MRYIWALPLLAAGLPATLAASPDRRGGELVLWYQRPAAAWVEALPVGNGRLGAMVFGRTAAERIQFNESTLWVGEPRDYTHAGAAEALPAIRRLLFEGKQAEAERLAAERFMSVPLRQMPYQPFGDLLLDFAGHEAVEQYRRLLDLDSATARTEYVVGGVRYRREVLVSHPQQVIAVRIEADKPGGLAFAARLASPHADVQIEPRSPRMVLCGVLPTSYTSNKNSETVAIARPLRFAAVLEVRAEGGAVRAASDRLAVAGADAATLVLAAATSFVDYRDVSADPLARCDEILTAAGGRTWAELRAAHVADHRRLFRRVALDLGPPPAARPTDERLAAAASTADPALAALYFQFGRYLLIASSRPGGQPANLQGLWNEELRPPWDSKWTVNINTQMNYWPAEPTNLAECHRPLFAMLADLAETGGRTAAVHYNARGWVLHHNTDLWRGAAPINNANHGIWPTGGAWLCQHLWRHFEYGGDRRFLAQTAYPLMKGAAEFFVDTLVEDPRSPRRWLISTPSNSPEQGGLVAGPTMDHQIIRELFASTARAAAILGIDEPLRQRLIDLRARIAPNQIGRHGQLQEWLEDVDDPKNKHRHLSHLWGVYPGEEIDARATPQLAAAARRSLDLRGDKATGWSTAWKISLWARLGDAERAHRLLGELLATSTYPNLFDRCPPFQIDGNFGGAAGVAELLLQSRLVDGDAQAAAAEPTYELELLPALPAAWKSGRVSGLRARGGFEVDLTWQDGTLRSALVRSARGRPLVLRHGEQVRNICPAAGETYRW